MSTNTEVVVVGGGPVGLVIALMVARAGISVKVLEANNEVIQSPRAMAYGPAAVHELERAGIAQECRNIGMEEIDYHADMRWIKINGEIVASVSRPKGGFDPVICGQHKVAEVILKHLARYPHAEVLWNHKVVEIKDRADSVTAVCETEKGNVEVTARYLVGSDGARSTVRKLIGCTFDGFTYDKMIVATNVYYPFRDYGWSVGQFIIDPEHFALIGKCAPDGLYRCSYGEDASLTVEQARANLDYKYNKMFPGPKPVKYDLKMFSPYKLHQRCSTKFRVGNVLLAGDAAHVCNPFGGMGLTTGLCDAGALADCLIGVLRKGCGDDLLDKYADIRREKFLTITNPVSQANIERLYGLNPDTAAQDDPFLKSLNELGNTPEFQKVMSENMLALLHDFTQYYPERMGIEGTAVV